MAKKNLHACKTYSDLENYARRKEREGLCETSNGGSHFRIKTDRGCTYLSRGKGNQQIGKGLLVRILKQFTLIGLGIFALVQILF